eukprot:scaffold63579_cov75-Phaeocystis_antarctica.AAC.1
MRSSPPIARDASYEPGTTGCVGAQPPCVRTQLPSTPTHSSRVTSPDAACSVVPGASQQLPKNARALPHAPPPAPPSRATGPAATSGTAPAALHDRQPTALATQKSKETAAGRPAVRQPCASALSLAAALPTFAPRNSTRLPRQDSPCAPQPLLPPAAQRSAPPPSTSTNSIQLIDGSTSGPQPSTPATAQRSAPQPSTSK